MARTSQMEARRVAAKFLGGEGAFAVTVAPVDFDQAIQGLEEFSTDLKAQFTFIFDDEVMQAVSEIRSAWPWVTGFSYKGWEWRRNTIGQSLAWTIFNSVSYTAYVHPKGNKKPLVESMVLPTIRRHATEGVRRFVEKIRQFKRRQAAETPQPTSAQSSFLSTVSRFLGF